MVGGKVSGHLDFSPPHHALARHGVVRPASREAGLRKSILRESAGGVLTVPAFEVKRDHVAGSLAGDGAAVDAVVGDGVAARAVVEHRNTGVCRRRVNAVAQGHRHRRLPIGGPRRDHDGCAGGGQDGRVLHFVDRRTGVGDATAIDRARCAEFSRQSHAAVGFSGAAVEPEQQLGKAAEPADFGADGDGASAGWYRAGERRGKDAVGLIVSARTGAHMQALAAGEAFVLDARKIVRALQRPSVQAGLKAAIGHEVRAVIRTDLDFIKETFAGALQVDNEAVVGGSAERFTKRAGPFDGRPQAFAGVVAVRPV